MEIDCDIKKEEVEKIVKELLEVDKGKKMKKNGTKQKKWAKEATIPLGSTSIKLKNFGE